MMPIHVTRTNTINNDDNKMNENKCMEEIFHDPENGKSLRWEWRKNLEMARSDTRNTGFYANYVGSKGTRKHAANNDNSKAKPSHYLKHLVKIGCPQHDLKPIFENDLKFNVNPTICTHKSWKCLQNLNNINNPTHFGRLIHELSMDEVGLEFKRSAYSIKPLLIKHGSFITNIFCKRIANTNFNKIFRPGSYGNSPSLKKGSWKDGKVFYVFKNDKLVLNIHNLIHIVFELDSPKSIMKDNKNKHYIIDGWKNVVGGVGFYSPSTSSNNAKKKHHFHNNNTKCIETVLVFRKSMDFPKECLQESKVKIYINDNAINRISDDTDKLIIGSKQLSLNIDTIPVLNNTQSSVMSYSSTHSNSPGIIPSVNHSPSPLLPDHDHIPIPINMNHGQEPLTATAVVFDGESVGQQSQSGSDMSIPCGGYGVHHGSSRSVISYRYNPMQSVNGEYQDQYGLNQRYYNEIDEKLQKDNYALNQRNEYLSTKVERLESLNKEYMKEHDRLMQEKNELEQRIAMLQTNLAQKQQEHQQLLQFQQQSQSQSHSHSSIMNEYTQIPQSQWIHNATIEDDSSYHIADDYTMDFTMNNTINLNNNGNNHNEMNYVDIMQEHISPQPQIHVHDRNYSQNMNIINNNNPFINNNNNNIYTNSNPWQVI